MVKKVLAGSDEDHRWRDIIHPEKPQTTRPNRPKEDVLKKVRDENAALNIKLNEVAAENDDLVSGKKDTEDKIKSLQDEVKSLKKQLSDVKKEAQDVVKATKNKSNVSRKRTSKVQVRKSSSGVRRKTK